MKRIAILAATLVTGSNAVADVLWYGGDFNQERLILSSHATGARAFDDFQIGGVGAEVHGLFAYMAGGATVPETASYEIRSGLTAGNGGMLLASGIASIQAQKTGNFGDRHIYRFDVAIPVIGLSADRYWMALAPVNMSGAISR